MFSGIIEHQGMVRTLKRAGSDFKLTVSSDCFTSNATSAFGLKIGSSVAINGVCLTISKFVDTAAEFDISSETARITTIGELEPNQLVNLEPALKVGQALDGHFVLGHVDEVVSLIKKEVEENTIKFVFSLPKTVGDLIAKKGSVTIDGVSLTVGDVTSEAFSVYLIPHSLSETTFKGLETGHRVNLEADCIARYLKNLSCAYTGKV